MHLADPSRLPSIVIATIGDEDIDTGVRDSTCGCPLALAFHRALAASWPEPFRVHAEGPA